MTVPHLELAQRWLTRADHDIITAKQTLLLPDGPTDTPCFHAQQAIEKAFSRAQALPGHAHQRLCLLFRSIRLKHPSLKVLAD